jgi:hypothetical protein
MPRSAQVVPQTLDRLCQISAALASSKVPSALCGAMNAVPACTVMVTFFPIVFSLAANARASGDDQLAGRVAGLPLSLIMNTRNLAGADALAFLETAWTSAGVS